MAGLDDNFNAAFQGQPSVDQAFNQLETPTTMPDNRAPAAAEPPIANDTHVNVIDPEGNLGSIPHAQLADAVNSGYRPATPAELMAYERHEKYGSGLEQLKTGLEGAASAATFGLSTGLERAAGVKAEDIQGRREENPVSHMIGEGAGLIGSAALLPGAGAAGVLTKAGEGAAELAGVAGAETAVAKIGSAAVKAAAENALFQSGDEASKMFSSDPNQTVQTALTDIGLSGVLGGTLGAGFGAVSPLWKATAGIKTNGLLKALSDRVGGIEGVVPDALNEAIAASGIDLAPEVRSALSGKPELEHMWQTLQESATGNGQKARESLQTFRQQAADATVQALGKSPEDIARLSDLSAYDAGADLKKTMVEQLKAQIDPISEQFEKVRERYKNVELPQGETKSEIVQTNPYETPREIKTSTPGLSDKLADDLTSLAAEKGWSSRPSSDEMGMIRQMIKELPLQKTLEDLRKYQSMVADEAFRKQMWNFGSSVKTLFRNAEDDLVTKLIGSEEGGAELLKQHALARASYKDAMNMIDELNSRLHVGKFNGPGSFVKALEDMSPEDVLRRLAPKNDADVLNLLSHKFPQAADMVKDYQIAQLLKSASQRALNPGEVINTKALFANIEKMSPEMRKFVISPEAGSKIEAIKQMVDALPAKMNNSGTAKTLDSLWAHVPASAAGLATLLTGHNPATALIVGGLAKVVGRDAPDAVRMAMLKFLGSNRAVDAGAFRSMVEMAEATIKGENLAGKAAKNVFKAGQEVLPQSKMPTQKDRDKLDKQIQKLQVEPHAMMDVGGHTGHYLPDHQTALAQTTTNAVNLLAQLKPNETPQRPLDPKPIASFVQKSQYNRALDIAQQPLIVLSHLKEGTLTPKDVQAVKTLYPALYTSLSNKLRDNMMEQIHKGETIPYQTRMGLSLFLGETLDSTLTQSSILAAQSAHMLARDAKAQDQSAPPQGKHSMNALNKLAPMAQTPGQAREAKKAQA